MVFLVGNKMTCDPTLWVSEFTRHSIVVLPAGPIAAAAASTAAAAADSGGGGNMSAVRVQLQQQQPGASSITPRNFDTPSPKK